MYTQNCHGTPEALFTLLRVSMAMPSSTCSTSQESIHQSQKWGRDLKARKLPFPSPSIPPHSLAQCLSPNLVKYPFFVCCFFGWFGFFGYVCLVGFVCFYKPTRKIQQGYFFLVTLGTFSNFLYNSTHICHNTSFSLWPSDFPWSFLNLFLIHY